MSEPVQERVRKTFSWERLLCGVDGICLTSDSVEWSCFATRPPALVLILNSAHSTRNKLSECHLNYFFNRKHNICKHRVIHSNRCKTYIVKNESPTAVLPGTRTCLPHCRNTHCRVTWIWAHSFLLIQLEEAPYMQISLSFIFPSRHILETMLHIL